MTFAVMNQKITIMQPLKVHTSPGFELGSTRTERIWLRSKWTWSWQKFKHRRYDVFHKACDVSNMICDILYGVPDTSYHRHFIFLWHFIPKGKNLTTYQSLHPCALHPKRVMKNRSRSENIRSLSQTQIPRPNWRTVYFPHSASYGS